MRKKSGVAQLDRVRKIGFRAENELAKPESIGRRRLLSDLDGWEPVAVIGLVGGRCGAPMKPRGQRQGQAEEVA